MIPLLSSKNVPMYACENLRGEGSSFFGGVLGMTSQIHVKMEQREKKKKKEAQKKERKRHGPKSQKEFNGCRTNASGDVSVRSLKDANN